MTDLQAKARSLWRLIAAQAGALYITVEDIDGSHYQQKIYDLDTRTLIVLLQTMRRELGVDKLQAVRMVLKERGVL